MSNQERQAVTTSQLDSSHAQPQHQAVNALECDKCAGLCIEAGDPLVREAHEQMNRGIPKPRGDSSPSLCPYVRCN